MGNTIYQFVSPPIKGQVWGFYVGLGSVADTDNFQVNPTLAVGDVKISKNSGSLANIETLPYAIDSSELLWQPLSASEMDTPRLAVKYKDAAGDEWQGCIVPIHTVSGTSVSNLSESDIWSYASRTLTMTAQQIVDAISGSHITIHRGDTFTEIITTAATAGYVSIDFSIKYSPDDPDDNAVLRIRKNASGVGDGLMRLNGASPSSSVLASLAVGATSITPTIDETVTAALPYLDEAYYDIQLITATTVTTIAEGRLDVNRDITRLTS